MRDTRSKTLQQVFWDGDFRMNLLSARLVIDLRDEVGTVDPCLRPEVAAAFADLCQSIKNLSDVTDRFLLQAEGGG